MSVTKTVHGSLLVNGDMTFDGTNIDPTDGVVTFRMPENATVFGPVSFATRSQLTEDALQEYRVSAYEMRVYNDFSSLLPTAPDGTSLGIDSNNSLLGTSAIGVTQTEYAAFMFQLPVEYVDAGELKVRIAGLYDNPASTANTLTVNCFEMDDAGSMGLERCGVTNNLTGSVASHDFAVTSSAFVSGDMLQFRITSISNDGGGAEDSANTIKSVKILMDIKG